MSDEQLELIKARFKSCDYISNERIVLEDGTDTSVLLFLMDALEIKVHKRIKNWIKLNLVGFWGNKSVKCNGHSNKIFGILNLIMEKLK